MAPPRTITGRPLAELKAGDQADLHVLVERISAHRSRHGEPFLVLDVADRSGTGTIRVFADSKAYAAGRALERRSAIKVRVAVESGGPEPDLKAMALRALAPGEDADLAALAGPLPAILEPVAWGVVAFDIETMPRLALDDLPERERHKIGRWAEEDARRETGTEWPGDEAIADSVRKALALNPLTNRIVSLALHSLATSAEACLVAAGDDALEPPALAVGEDELLRLFWRIVRRARTLVGFNSRRFDVPVLLTRSALLGVSAGGVDLLSDRWGRDLLHVDLLDVLAGRGAAADRRMSLELACFAFGIRAKTRGHGSEVATLVGEGRLEELAEYNLEDARATGELYRRLAGTWV